METGVSVEALFVNLAECGQRPAASDGVEGIDVSASELIVAFVSDISDLGNHAQGELALDGEGPHVRLGFLAIALDAAGCLALGEELTEERRRRIA